MTSIVSVKDWFDRLDAKAHLLVSLMGLVVLAIPAFHLISVSFVNAFLSGVIWMVCVAILLCGGKRVDFVTTAAAALVAAGLTTSIPSIPYDYTPVDWGAALYRLGLLLMVVKTANDIYLKAKEESR